VTDTIVKSNPGPRINIPAGLSAEELARKGLQMEADGVPPDLVASERAIGRHTYRKMRDILFLADRDDLSENDTKTVDRALRIMNATDQVADAWPLVEPIATKVWGTNVKGHSRGRVERNRITQFEHGFGMTLQACETAAGFDVPYLSEQRVRQALDQLEIAVKNLAVLKRRIAEIRQ
jgi:hypothetical protein